MPGRTFKICSSSQLLLLFFTLYRIGVAESTQHTCDRLTKQIACAKISGILPFAYNPDPVLQGGTTDSLQSSTPQWKTTARCGVQFVGATALATGCLIMTGASAVQEGWNSSASAQTYIFANTVLTGPVTWIIGKSLGHEGSIYKAAIGAGIGGAVGILPLVNHDVSEDGNRALITLVLLVPPALGAVIGANL